MTQLRRQTILAGGMALILFGAIPSFSAGLPVTTTIVIRKGIWNAMGNRMTEVAPRFGWNPVSATGVRREWRPELKPANAPRQEPGPIVNGGKAIIK